MSRTMTRSSLLAVLALLLVVGLLATAGPAMAGAPKCPPSFTWYGGIADILDDGRVFPDCPAAGNTTILDWRIYSRMQVCLPNATDEQSWWYLFDWNMVLLDKPGPDYPDDPESLIPGWHYHWGTGVISTDEPNPVSPFEAAKSTWLWKTAFTGITTPAGVHYITESWTGCNKYKGLKAISTWTMAAADYQDAAGKVWIVH